MNAGRSPSRFSRALGRRRAAVVVPALCATMAGALAALVLPRVYRAEAEVEIAGQGGLAGAEFESRVAAVQERFVSTDAVSAAAAKLHLAGDLASLAEHASCSVKPSGEGAVTTATIACRDGDPEVCTRVAAALADEAVHLSGSPALAAREKASADAAAAEKAAKTTLEAASKARQEYRDANREYLEGAGQKLQATREQKKQLRDVTIATLEQKKRELEDMLAQEKQYDIVVVHTPDAVKLAAVDERLAAAKERVKQLMTVDKRPDTDIEVVAQKKRVADVEEERKKLVTEAPPTETRRENDQWLQLAKARNDTQSRLDAANRQLKLLGESEKEQEELARRTPEFEAQAAKLDAAEASAKQEDETKAAALAKADADLSAERSRGSLTIRIAGAPEKPDHPAGPGALVLAGAGLALGAIAGFVAALVADGKDHSFRDEGAATAFLGVPALGAVRVIETPAEAAERRAKQRRGSAVLMGLAVLACVVVAVAVFGDAHGIADLVKSVVG
jgi:hypothetical protein